MKCGSTGSAYIITIIIIKFSLSAVEHGKMLITPLPKR
jgi:hypothetical protein